MNLTLRSDWYTSTSDSKTELHVFYKHYEDWWVVCCLMPKWTIYQLCHGDKKILFLWNNDHVSFVLDQKAQLDLFAKFISRNIQATPVYGVYISQLVLYSRSCSSFHDFCDRWLLLMKLLNQWFQVVKLRSSLW